MHGFRRMMIAGMMLLPLVIAGCDKEAETVGQTPPETAGKEQTVQETPVAEGDRRETVAVELDDSPQAPEGWGKAPSLPKTMVDFIEYPVGRFNGIENIEGNSEAEAFYAKLPVLSEQASDEEIEQYFAYMYSLIKPEYPDPRDISPNYALAQTPGGAASPAELNKETYNVEIVLDSSGSMANAMGGRTRMELAKEAIAEFLSSLPKEANVGLRVYGHKGTGSNVDKDMSCQANELVYEVKPYDQAGLDAAHPGDRAGRPRFGCLLRRCESQHSLHCQRRDRDLRRRSGQGCGGIKAV